MTSDWKPSDAKISDFYLTLAHKKTGELVISCKYGEIWPYSATEYKAYCHSTRISNKINTLFKAQRGQGRLKPGDETVWKFDENFLDRVARTLGYRHNRKSAMKFMEKRSCLKN